MRIAEGKKRTRERRSIFKLIYTVPHSVCVYTTTFHSVRSLARFWKVVARTDVLHANQAPAPL